MVSPIVEQTLWVNLKKLGGDLNNLFTMTRQKRHIEIFNTSTCYRTDQIRMQEYAAVTSARINILLLVKKQNFNYTNTHVLGDEESSKHQKAFQISEKKRKLALCQFIECPSNISLDKMKNR